mmetsp:Transcript_25917/g.35898  ORF Transcript_25917/g.35898 Transcript_25917/m.35898 type:complete len:112 (-) Transcript_25917:632-967(-)
MAQMRGLFKVKGRLVSSLKQHTPTSACQRPSSIQQPRIGAESRAHTKISQFFNRPPQTREETIKKAKIYIVLALRIHGNACGDTRQSCTRRQIVAAYDVAQTNETTNKTVI